MFTKSYLNSIKYHGQYRPEASKMTSLLLKRKIALVLLWSEGKRKNKTPNQEQKEKSKDQIYVRRDRTNLHLAQAPTAASCEGLGNSITTRQAYNNYFPE